ncbi:MAG: transcription-repair coupling factor [Ignavibacteriae bacterium]|nr:transcription-repair coupling factor [Ignavibacteriota bacterium]
MKSEILENFFKSNSFELLHLNFNGKTDIKYISKLAGSARSLTAVSIFKKYQKCVLFFNSVQEISETKVELSLLGFEKELVVFESLIREELQERLTDLASRNQFIMLAPYKLINIPLYTQKELSESTTNIEIGGELSYDDIIEYLNLLNYQNDKFVENPGEYAVRGSIIDFWSYSEKQPCRLEFDGDFLESIRHFDHESQRSSLSINSITLAAPLNADKEKSSTIFDYLKDAIVFASYIELNQLYVKKKKEKVIEEENDLDEELKSELFEGQVKPKELIEEEPTEDEFLFNSLNEILSKGNHWLIEDELNQSENRISLGIFDTPIINSNYETLFNRLDEYSQKGFTTYIAVENELQLKRLRDLLTNFNDELKSLIESERVQIKILPLKKGFVIKSDQLMILTDYEIFNKPYRTKLSTKSKYKRTRAKDFASLKRGDFVVHENFGIGQYDGLQTIKIGNVDQESIKILYAEGGVVYVNLNYLSLVKKFSSKDNAAPRLSLLGSNEWKNTKKKVKAKIKDAARDLIKLYAQRKSAEGYMFGPDTILQKELEASFFYEDTPDQSKVNEEVKNDMESINPMDRLVCGDVGFGKTEIAVRAAFKAVNDSKQVALLVPTTILAEQHYNTFKDRLGQFPVKVAVLSRFQTKTQQKTIVEQVVKGEVDILIGTHRILSKDVIFKELGLLIIDEEHRFGVMHKERLRQLKANVDTLTLTATPIPRTLNLSLLGARDLSIIATPPPNRQPIYTKVDVFNITKIREWILDELIRNGQVYFVHDRVQSIDKIAAYIKKHIPKIEIGIAHGQMKPQDLENVIHDFLHKKYHVLLATKIIESGIDIPNVNTIIINRADRFGLAELHQLRGRVGRSDRQAYAYLIVPSLDSITKKAVRRLQAIEEYTDLGEGFNLSMRDLEIRGAGNLLGTEQSGAIDSVGFDMYMKLLDEAVEELKQSEFKSEFKDLPQHIERADTNIDTYFEIGIPKSFMPDQSDRLSYYTALFSMVNIEEVDEIKEEMIDKFGRLPVIIERLISTAVLRYYASYSLLERVVIQENKIIIVLPKAEREEFYQNKFSLLMQWIMENHSKDVQFKQIKDVMKLEINNKYDSPEKSLQYTIKFIKDMHSNIINNNETVEVN